VGFPFIGLESHRGIRKKILQVRVALLPGIVMLTRQLELQNGQGVIFQRDLLLQLVEMTRCCIYRRMTGRLDECGLIVKNHVFAYFGVTDWNVVDDFGNTVTPLDLGTTGSAGMKYDLTLTSTNTYSLALTPLSNPSGAYMQTGPLTTNLPINWVNFRLYWDASTGLSDTADNFGISSMTIGWKLNIQQAGSNVVLSWATNAAGFNLEYTSTLSAGALWQTNLTAPAVINGQYVVTNAIAGTQKFYRLKQ